MEAMVARAKPGVTEYELRAAAGAAILEGGGDIDFLIIGSTPMANPALVFGNPRPSGRVLVRGDIINMELAAGYRGYTAQIGSPICLGPPTDRVRKFWDEIALPGFKPMADEIAPGRPLENIRTAGTSSAIGSRPRNSSRCSGPAWCSWPNRTRSAPTGCSASSSATRSSSPRPGRNASTSFRGSWWWRDRFFRHRPPGGQ